MQSLHAVEEVGPPVLAVEGLCSWSACVAGWLSGTYPGHHGVDGGEVGLAGRAPVDALAGEVATVAHAHCC